MGDSGKPRAPRLGKLLLQKGLINHEQLVSALRIQADSGVRLGSVLVEQGTITERQLRQCLRWQGLLQAASLVAGLSACGAQLGYCDSPNTGKSPPADTLSEALSQTVAEQGKFSWAPPERYWFSPEQRQISYQLVEKASNKVIHFAQVKVKNSVVTVLRGHYAAGVEAYEYGTRFQADWSNRHIRLKLTYQF